ncbi:MAG: acetate--CoA ligase family protein [Deltaproteobacteria bacterium]|nr:acetate--CoA ligase family protein [Deltaproteobacteria bacterium]
MTDIYSRFSGFFYPESIAVFGVSPEENNLGKNIVMNCLTLGYHGEILPVGIKGGIAFGQRICRSIEEIDRDVDLAVILTPAKTVPGILEQCGRRGIRRAVIESGGFSELGKEGRPLEEACLEIARKYDIRFIGPNGIGITNMECGLGLSFMLLQQGLSLGPVSVIAQSGGVGLTFLNFLVDENIGLNKFISVGNKLNVDENDLLDYLIQDEGTKIILVYLEGFTDGRLFVEIAGRSHKPILVYKSNRFAASASIARSHTAALSADDRLVDFALEQAGCIRLNTLNDAMDYIKSRTLPPMKGNRLAIVSRSGGHAVIAADACAYYGFDLPDLPEDLRARFESRFRAHVIRLQNPLDLGDLFDLEFCVYIVDEMLKRDDVDGVMLGHGYFRGSEQEASRALLKRVEQLVDTYQKPVAPVILTESMEREYLKKNLKFPMFWAPENAMRALKFSYIWSNKAPAPEEIPTSPRDEDAAGARRILESAAGRDHLLLGEAMGLLRSYNFPLPPHGIARTVQRSLQVWRSLDSAVAMKLNVPHISHKTDSGALRLDLDSEDQIAEAFQEFLALGEAETEVLIQAMVRGGREVILGGKRDPVFGPTILFGIGGIFVEALDDVVWRVAPITRRDARDMIHSIRGMKVLTGIRGQRAYDLPALEDMLVRLSRMIMNHPEIQEIDINPVMVLHEGKGARALDARVLLNTAV